MKRIISFILSAIMLTALLPTAFATDSVTEADVKKAQSVVSIKNNTEDYKIFNETKHDENISAENSFVQYYVSQLDKTDGEYVTHKAFDGLDAKTAKISEAVFDEKIKEQGIEYRYKSSDDSYYGGFSIYNRGKSSVHISGYKTEKINSMRLYFTPSDIAAIMNKNNLGNPQKIMFLFLNDNNILNDDQADGGVTVICTDDGEYAVINAKYTDGRLSDYLLLDSETFIEGMQGKLDKVQDAFYDKFQTQTSPSFADISGDSAVELLARLGILNGYEDGTFGGDRTITRAEAAKLVASFSMNGTTFDAYDKEADGWFRCDFADVPSGYWARKYIIYGSQKGYISGSDKVGEKAISDTTEISIDGQPSVQPSTEKYIDIYNFYPENNVTEQEMAKMLVSAMDMFGDTMAQAEGGWPDGYISVAKRLGICETATERLATRLTAAHMIKNALDAYVSTDTDDYTDYESGGVSGGESIFAKGIYYNLQRTTVKYVKLNGRISEKYRESEFSFVVAEDTVTPYFSCKKGDEMKVYSKYGDLDGFVETDCNIYCELRDGNLVVIMAE